MKRVILFCAVFGMLAGAGRIAAAEDFFAGKKITLTSFGGAGNNYDTYARLVSRHLSKYIPGHPPIFVVNQPGAGGLTAINYASRIAPQDGTLFTLVSDGLLMFEATGRPGILDSLTKFKWLGALSSSNVVTATWYKSNIKTLDDAKKREVRLGGSGAGAMSSVVPELYNSFVGTRFSIIQGYQSAPKQNLAMDRGELDFIQESADQGNQRGQAQRAGSDRLAEGERPSKRAAADGTGRRRFQEACDCEVHLQGADVEPFARLPAWRT
jgi:tripartite-type tricarboxylate transporter receptor subunit TctC